VDGLGGKDPRQRTGAAALVDAEVEDRAAELHDLLRLGSDHVHLLGIEHRPRHLAVDEIVGLDRGPPVLLLEHRYEAMIPGVEVLQLRVDLATAEVPHHLRHVDPRVLLRSAIELFENDLDRSPQQRFQQWPVALVQGRSSAGFRHRSGFGSLLRGRLVFSLGFSDAAHSRRRIIDSTFSETGCPLSLASK
jgi:hypothetical protein